MSVLLFSNTGTNVEKICHIQVIFEKITCVHMS